jgi:HEAT repeat protein
MMKRVIRDVILVVGLFVGVAGPSAAEDRWLERTVPPGGKAQAARLTELLKTDAPLKDKFDACRQLAIVGGRESIPVLASLLPDEKLSDMARYALEPLSDRAVDDALREAAEKLHGRPLVGVITSLGVRRDAKAVTLLSGKLRSNDAAVVEASARALGRIGTAEAVQSLQETVAAAPAAVRLAPAEGLFRAAESLVAAGKCDAASAIYRQLAALPDMPQQVRVGALRGKVLARPQDAVAILKPHLGGDGDLVLFLAAVRIAQPQPGTPITRMLVDAMGNVASDRRIVLLQALGRRRDAAALADLVKVAKNRTVDKAVRLAAVHAWSELQGRRQGLLDLCTDADSEIAQAAQEGLAAMVDRGLEDELVKMLSSDAKQRRLLALELLGRCRATSAFAAVLRSAEDADPDVRRLALKRLGELGAAGDLAKLVDLIGRRNASEVDDVEQAIRTVCANAADAEACAQQLASLLPSAAGAQKVSLVRVLGALGGAAALPSVRGAAKSQDVALRTAAIAALAGWKSPEAIDDLLALAQDSASDPAARRVALGAYVEWAGNEKIPADRRLDMCRKAAALGRSDEEKKRLLGSLGAVASTEALPLVEPHLSDASVRDEAVAAVVSIAEKLLSGNDAAQAAAKLIAPLRKAAQSGASAPLVARAKAALAQAQAKAGGN